MTTISIPIEQANQPEISKEINMVRVEYRLVAEVGRCPSCNRNPGEILSIVAGDQRIVLCEKCFAVAKNQVRSLTKSLTRGGVE